MSEQGETVLPIQAHLFNGNTLVAVDAWGNVWFRMLDYDRDTDEPFIVGSGGWRPVRVRTTPEEET